MTRRWPMMWTLIALASAAVHARAATAAPAASNPLDDAFRSYELKLPAPVTLSDSNGASTECAAKRGATYTLLATAAAALPIHGDADLPVLVRWARHADLCIRQIALDALVPRIGFNAQDLVLPSMNDPEHYLFHDILASAHAYLDRKHVAYDPAIFAGLIIAPGAREFHTLVDGVWTEDAPGKGFQETVEVTGAQIRVTSRDVPPDPKWPDTTQTTEIKSVALDHGQYVVTGNWNVESNTAGYRGPKNVPAQFVLRFWPVGDRVLWAKTGNSPYWNKFRK